jgi:hypothetical protein
MLRKLKFEFGVKLKEAKKEREKFEIWNCTTFDLFVYEKDRP